MIPLRLHRYKKREKELASVEIAHIQKKGKKIITCFHCGGGDSVQIAHIQKEHTYLSNGRFKNADHQAVVNSNYSRLSIATFQNPAPEAIVYPLKMRDGEKSVLEKPITFTEMYSTKMSKDIELARLKKLAKEQMQEELEKTQLELSKPLEQILA